MHSKPHIIHNQQTLTNPHKNKQPTVTREISLLLHKNSFSTTTHLCAQLLMLFLAFSPKLIEKEREQAGVQTTIGGASAGHCSFWKRDSRSESFWRVFSPLRLKGSDLAE
jgi:hypothetical protein